MAVDTQPAKSDANLRKVDIHQETIEKNYALFRYGRLITETMLRTETNRNPVAEFLCYGLPFEALHKGWTILEKDTDKEVDWSPEFEEKLEPLLPDIVRGIGNERTFGHALNALLEDDQNNTQFRSFEPDMYTIQANEFGNLIQAKATELVRGFDTEQVFRWQTPEELANIYHSVNRPSRHRNQGISYLVPIWDDVSSISLLSEMSAIFIIRVGAGRIIVTAPASMINDSETRASIITAVQESNSGNMFLLLPQPDSMDEKLEVNMESTTAAYDPVQQRKVFIQNISTKTNVPSLRLEGVTQNYATAAEEGTSYLSVLEDIQNENYDLCKWISKRIAEKVLGKSEDFDIQFNVRQELTEMDRLDLLKAQWNTLITIMRNADVVSIALEDAMQSVGLEYKITKVEPLEQEEDESFGAFGGGPPKNTTDTKDKDKDKDKDK